MATAFESDVGAYRRELPALLERSSGRAVLIHGAEVVGTFNSLDEAMSEGYARFDNSPFLTKTVSADDMGSPPHAEPCQV